MTILFEFGAQSMDVISLSCYPDVSDHDPRQMAILSQTLRTSDRVSVAFQSFPALENICASFEFRLTATSDHAPKMSDPIACSQQQKSTLTGSILIESMGRNGTLSKRINFRRGHNNCRGLAVDYCGRSCDWIRSAIVGDKCDA